MSSERKFKAVVLTSNKSRHVDYARAVQKHFDLVGVISAEKKAYYDKQISSSEVIKRHFAKFEELEREWFGNSEALSCCESVRLSGEQSINDGKWVDWAKRLRPDVIFLFGTEILKAEWLSAFPEKIINLHLGLSPFFRGSGTLFWPFYYNEIQYIGATIHIADAEVDAGGILGYAIPKLEAGDDFYSINLKTIARGIEIAPELGIQYLDGAIAKKRQDNSIGRVFRKKDFNEMALTQALGNIPKTGLGADTINGIHRMRLELGIVVD